VRWTILAGPFVSLLVASVFVYGASNFRVAQTQVSVVPDLVQPKFALLVGITNYKNQQINKIDGCENNVPLLAESLVKNYGFLPGDVQSLLNQNASKAAVTNTFRSHLIDNARKAKENGKKAVVLFYFCGHGSQYPDQDGDENDQLDETLLAFDSRTSDVSDILDDELDDLKAELRPFTDNTTLILESCHSGTGSRESLSDNTYVTEEVDRDERKLPPYKRRFPPTSDDDALTYTEISASSSIKTAKSEAKQYCNCDKPLSLMTKALVQALNRATASTSYRELVREVSAAVAERSRQDPQVEGNRDAILFQGAAKRAKPYIEVEKILPNNQLLIRAGRIQGLKVGSQVSIYAATSLNNVGNEGWLTNGIVSDNRDFQAVVSLPSPVENPNVKRVTETSHVVIASPVFGGGPILLLLKSASAGTRNPKQDELTTTITNILKADGLLENQLIKLVDSDGQIRAEAEAPKGVVRLKKSTVAEAFINQELISTRSPRLFCDANLLKTDASGTVKPSAATEVYYLDDGSEGGTPLFGKYFLPDSENLADEIAQAIRNFALQANLRSLDNAASTLSSQIQVSLWNVELNPSCKEGEVKYEAKTPTGTQIDNGNLPVNTYLRLKIKNISGEANRKRTKDKNASGEPLYITLLSLGNNGDVSVVSPRLGAKDPIADGAEIEKYFQTKPPVGIEHYVVIVSRQFIDFSFIDSKLTRSIPLSPLGQILTQSGTRTRDTSSLIPDEPDQWGVIHVEINVVSKR
jgi:Caspase domain.